MHPCTKEDQQHPGMQEKDCHQVEGGDPSLLLSTAETHLEYCVGAGLPSMRDARSY